MPPTEEARIAEIAAKSKAATETYSVVWQYASEPLPAITLSLDSVLLNPSSHRIRAHIESHADAAVLRDAPYSEHAQTIIGEILTETPGFGVLADNLRESGQLEFGIVTHAGVLVKIRRNDPDQARRVRDGRIAGVLVGVTYRNLRRWDTNEFLTEYVEPLFDDDDHLLPLVGGGATNGSGSSDGDIDDGLAILDGLGGTDATTIDPKRLLVRVAELYGADPDAPAGGGLTKAQLYEEIKERITQASQDSEEHRKDQQRQSTPLRLVKQAQQKVARARDALPTAQQGPGFDHGALDHAVGDLRKEVNLLAEANKVDA